VVVTHSVRFDGTSSGRFDLKVNVMIVAAEFCTEAFADKDVVIEEDARHLRLSSEGIENCPRGISIIERFLSRYRQVDPACLSISSRKLEIASKTGFVTVMIRCVTAVWKTDVVNSEESCARMRL
jgi:hypothetical protein